MLYKFLFPFIGLLLLGLAYVFFLATIKFSKEGGRVLAIVKSIDARVELDFIEYYPVFEYEINNEIYVKVNKQSATKWKGKEGSQHVLVYDRNNPNDFKVLSFWGLLTKSIILSCSGIILFTISAWYYWYTYFFIK